jgi:hypothetical protein
VRKLSCLAGIACLTLASAFLPAPLKPATAQAVTLSDGEVSFVSPARLLEAYSLRKQVVAHNATWYFTLDLPATADEPLSRVLIRPQDLAMYMFPYNLEETQAFEGTRQNRGADLPLGEVSQDEDSEAVTITFDPPLQPGQVFTIALRPRFNPRRPWAYVFDVLTYPAGDSVRESRAGVAQLQFYEPGRDGIIF